MLRGRLLLHSGRKSSLMWPMCCWYLSVLLYIDLPCSLCPKMALIWLWPVIQLSLISQLSQLTWCVDVVRFFVWFKIVPDTFVNYNLASSWSRNSFFLWKWAEQTLFSYRNLISSSGKPVFPINIQLVCYRKYIQNNLGLFMNILESILSLKQSLRDHTCICDHNLFLCWLASGRLLQR